ncbi:uncharacterized protein LOC129615410 [Condylostylus longicornis]|uniref:uncharacterized protein LOC129615410 n=1 Tax=Condylostylus longicornis TaxID=2530218 RepID=UPI00244DE9B3|nr:uncharacterized protein LOC129615410 [Condylostylus longicornis]
MRGIIFTLLTLLYTKITIGVLIQDSPKLHNGPGFGYYYNKPASPLSSHLTEFKPIFPTFSTLQPSIPIAGPSPQIPSLSPLSFHPSSPSGPSLQSSNQFHTGHLPQSIHFDIPPAVLHNFLSPDDNIYFSDDGRILKQYEVMERILNDLEHPGNLLSSPSLFFDSIVSKFVAQNPSLAGQILHPVTRNHGPIALGSGSLGYIQLRNGAAHLGSGSLGYITAPQASQAVIDAKTRKTLAPPGPLHFGHNFAN